MSERCECPACGETYIVGEDCECGYCAHAGAHIGETCLICGGYVAVPAVDPVAELLDAADEVLTLIGDASGYLYEYESNAVDRLRIIVTQMQGNAGLRVSASDSPAGGAS